MITLRFMQFSRKTVENWLRSMLLKIAALGGWLFQCRRQGQRHMIPIKKLLASESYFSTLEIFPFTKNQFLWKGEERLMTDEQFHNSNEFFKSGFSKIFSNSRGQEDAPCEPKILKKMKEDIITLRFIQFSRKTVENWRRSMHLKIAALKRTWQRLVQPRGKGLGRIVSHNQKIFVRRILDTEAHLCMVQLCGYFLQCNKKYWSTIASLSRLGAGFWGRPPTPQNMAFQHQCVFWHDILNANLQSWMIDLWCKFL